MTSTSNYFHLTIISIVLMLIQGCSVSNRFSVSDLKCENLESPLGVNTLYPRFSWKNHSARHGAIQTAYQIIVSDDISKLNENEAILWNSGKVNSSASLLIEYSGKPLSSGQLLFWKVRIWDENGKESAWSKPTHASIGLLDKDDWNASYIGFPTEKRFESAPQLRKTFSLDKADKEGEYLLHVNSLGYHEVYLNGEKVSKDVLSPAVTQFNKRSLIVTYNITPFLKEENDLIIWLGSGWYFDRLPGVIGDGPVTKAQMEYVHGGIREVVLYTDTSWEGRDSEYSQFNDWWWGYGGEIIAGNLETRNKVFETPDKLNWENISVVDIPEHQVTPQTVEPNRIRETIYPTRIDRLNDTVVLVDMGTSLTGWLEVSFPNLEKSQEIVLQYADHLEEDEELPDQKQTDKYIASGSGTELFINKFNYRSFRYVRISNLKQPLQLTDIKGYHIHTNFEITSSFECSDKDMNRIHDMVKHTLRCVGLGGYLVDCSHLERLGYGGDGNASTVTAQTMFNHAPLYSNWLQAWADVIREDGSMPHTAPNPFSAGGGPYWCGFIISASWNTYKHYGDRRILEKHYPVMQLWLEYVDKYTVNGLLKKWPNTEYRNWYLGDWATPEGVGNPDHIDEKSIDLVSNCYISVCFDQMKNIAEVLGKTNDAKHYCEKRSQLNKTIHDIFFNEQEGIYATGSQIDLIFPMLAGVTPIEMQEKLTQTLIERTHTKYNGHLNTGLVGIQVMMDWAATVYKSDFIYSMLKKENYPGYLYMLNEGATATWEHWNGERSRIHNCYNGVGQWFYQVVGGIRSKDGEVAFKRFIVDPQIPKGITWAKAIQETPYGGISVYWKLEDNNLTLDLKVPVGSNAELILPNNTTIVNINNKNIRVETNIICLNSGSYIISYPFVSF